MEVKQDETFNVQIIREKPHEGFTFFLFLLNTVELDKTFSLQEVKEIIKLNSKFYVNALDLKKKKILLPWQNDNVCIFVVICK